MQLVVIGNSHVVALLEAFEAATGEAGSDLPADLHASFVWAKPGTHLVSTGTPKSFAREEVASWETVLPTLLDPSTCVAVLWAGNQMNERAMLGTSEQFDVVLPDADARGDGATGGRVVPYSVIRKVVTDSLLDDSELAKLVSTCRNATDRLCFLAPPPPLPEIAVRDRMPNEAHFVAVAGQLGVDLTNVPLVDEGVRHRLWRVMIDGYRQVADANGADFVEPPAEAGDADGLLRPVYWNFDVTHANPAYGRLYLRDIVDWVVKREYG